MGYYVSTVDTNIFLDKKYFKHVYEKMCALNDFDELKRGGCYGGTSEQTGKYNPNKWFSWMDYNYPETCLTMSDILHQIGFDLSFDDDGNLIGLSYDNKTGNEEYFLACFAPFMRDKSYIEFRGEDADDLYRFYYVNDKCYLQRAQVSYNYEYSEELQFAKMTESDKSIQKMMEKYKTEMSS